MFAFGLPVLAPSLRAEYGLSLSQFGVVLAAVPAGALVTVFLWGLAADRFGERFPLVLGLCTCAISLAAVAYAPGFGVLVGLVLFAGACGGSVLGPSGRAVMHWFPPEERGFALAVRQTASPVGGLVAALVLPPVERAGGGGAALLSLAGFCLAGALVGGAFIRERHVDEVITIDGPPGAMRDARLWRLCFASGLYGATLMMIIGFVVLFLHSARGFSTASAGAVLAAIFALGSILRIGVGRWSDRLATRIVPLRHLGLAIVATTALVAALTHAPSMVLVPTLLVAGSLSMAWNGLAATAAVEIVGRPHSGAAIGVQMTVLSASTLAAPIAFAATVSATSWWLGFGLAALVTLAGWLLLKPLSEHHTVPVLNP